MQNLSEYREKIEKIDAELIKLFVERMKLSKAIGEYKKEEKLPVFDSQREEELKLRNLSLVDDEYKKAYLEVFEKILKVSKDQQL